MPKLSRRAVCAAGASLLAGPALGAQKAAPPPAAVTAGALLPLSGAFSLTGDECLRGMSLAVDEINAAGGVNGQALALVTGDAYGQDQAQPAAEALIAGHAGLILGSGASDLSYPGSAAAELAQIPYIELNAPADGICARGFRYLLRVCETTTMIAAVAAATIGAKFPNAKLGLLFNTGATGGATAAASVAALKQAKIAPLLVIGYPEDTVDLREPVGRLKRAGAEAVLHAANPGDTLLFFAALQEIGWRPEIIGCGAGYEYRETAYALGPAFDGTVTVAAPFYPPRAQYVAAAYLARYGMPPRAADSLTAFVGAKLVFDILNTVGGDPSRLLDGLRKVDIPAGTLANGFGVAFDKTGQNTRSFATARQWRGQQLVALT
jgi:branched-chain amino acid transport system substrate-binding protein